MKASLSDLATLSLPSRTAKFSARTMQEEHHWLLKEAVSRFFER